MPRSSLSGRAAVLVVCSAFFLTACEPPVEEGAVSAHLQGVDFRTPSATSALLGEPAPIAPQTSPPGRPQAQLFFGTDPVARTSRAASTDPTGGVRLNFDGASLRQVVDAILGEVLGVNYTIDPAVDGTVILASTAPLSESDMLTVLETILQMHGATLVDLGGTYAVLAGSPTVGAAQITPVGGGAPPPLIVGTGVTIVPLRYISANAAAQFIQPLLSLPEQVRVDDARNLVLFVGNAAERQNVVRTLGEINVDWMAGRSVGVFPLQTATPESLIPELEGLFAPLDGFDQQVRGVRFLPMARLNAVLAIASQPDQLVEIERWVQRLDRGSGSTVQFFVYQLQHTAARDLAALLNESFGDAQQPRATPASAADPMQTGMPGDTGLVDDGFFGAPLEGGFTPSISGPGTDRDVFTNVKIVADESANALVIRATPQAYQLIEQTIRRLDRAPLQVLIEATIAEVVLNDQLRYGVQYYFSAGSFQGGFNTSSPPGATGNNSLLEPLAQLPGFNFIFTPGNSNITIDALARITDVQVLSSPSLVVQDNSEAVLTVGDEVPLITRTSQSVDNPDAPIVANIEYRNTGVILEVRPRINTNNVVTLEVSQEVSRVQELVARADRNPIIAQRRIASKVNVTSGQTVVLGGLIQNGSTQAVDKVPVLGDIPVLGNLFRTTNNQSQRTELIVFITPRVIRNAEDARDISEELRARMRAARPSAEVLEPAPAPALPPVQPAPQAPPPPTAAPRPLTTSSAEATPPEAGSANGAAPAPASLGGMRFVPATAVIAPPPQPDDGTDSF